MVLKVNEQLKGGFKATIVLVIIGCLIYWFYPGSGHMSTNTKQVEVKTPNTVTQQTQLQVKPKQSVSEPDLIVNNNYKAIVNGETLSVPSVPKTSTIGDTTTVTQEIDLTPILSKLRPNWEVGTGVGVTNGHLYVPISLQRNYKYNKSIQLEVHLDPKDNFKATGFEVQHKWTF